MYRFAMAWRRLTLVWASGHAQTDPAAAVSTAAETTVATDTLETLVSFVKLRDELRQDIKALKKQIDSAQSEAEKG